MSEKQASILLPGLMEIDANSGKIINVRVSPDANAVFSYYEAENREFDTLPTIEELMKEQNYIPRSLSEIFKDASELFESEEDKQRFCDAFEESKK
ncbi:MAG: hypothetical protein LBJ67_08640 [Planctomycetaceae bacterium]|jgi:hypothetical protein|nr:hypothetical protein [Planctomycetaceae bacterium]